MLTKSEAKRVTDIDAILAEVENLSVLDDVWYPWIHGGGIDPRVVCYKNAAPILAAEVKRLRDQLAVEAGINAELRECYRLLEAQREKA